MWRKLSLTVILLAILGGIAGQPAQAHFLNHKRNLSLEQRIAYFKRSIAHSQHAILWYRNVQHDLRQSRRAPAAYSDVREAIKRGLRFHQAALRWYRSLLARYQARWNSLHPPLPPHYSDWLCIHRYEGAWNDSGSPYWGGLQMDIEFQASYGNGLLSSKGTADHWTPLEQMWAAERAWRVRGFNPWPNTARYCGLL
jgi:hypothetical protein